MLIHVNPREAAMLKASGGIGSVNPKTGLHQYYDDGESGQADDGTGDVATNGSLDQGQDEGHGQYGPGAPGSVGTTGEEGSMNSIGQLGRGSLEAQRDDAAVNQMTVDHGHVSGVNAASSTMDGLSPSFSDRVGDFFGANTPGGFLGSNAAQKGAGLVGSMIGGPGLGMALAGGVGMMQGRDLSNSFGGLGSLAQGMMDHGISGPASAQSQTNGTEPNTQMLAGSPDPTQALASSPYLGGGIGNLPGFSTSAPADGKTPQGAQWGADLQRKLAVLQGSPVAPY